MLWIIVHQATQSLGFSGKNMKWVAIYFFRESSSPEIRHRSLVSLISRWVLYHKPNRASAHSTELYSGVFSWNWTHTWKNLENLQLKAERCLRRPKTPVFQILKGPLTWAPLSWLGPLGPGSTHRDRAAGDSCLPELWVPVSPSLCS